MKDILLFDEILELKNCTGTFKYAHNLLKKNEISGNFLVISEKQTSGQGRNHNSWYSPEGGIWSTAGLYGLVVESNITIFTGICIHQTLIELFPELKKKLKIKWPNDIYLENKKLAGILSEKLNSKKYHLIGIGINTNINNFPKEIEKQAISLQLYLNKKIENELLIRKLFAKVAKKLPKFIEDGFDIKYYKKHSYLKGKEVILDTSFDRFSGKVLGLNNKGAILLQMRSGMIQPFYAGSISLINDEV